MWHAGAGRPEPTRGPRRWPRRTRDRAWSCGCLPPAGVQAGASAHHRSLPVTLVLHVALRGDRDRLPAPPLRVPQEDVVRACSTGGLPLQLAVAEEAVGGQAPVGKRGPDGAARLPVVEAVGEPARGREVFDIGERRGQAVGGTGDAECPDSRRVDQRARRRGAGSAPGGSWCAGRGSRPPGRAQVRWRSSPRRALTSVDLPTPELPSTTAVMPGCRWSRDSAATPSPDRADSVRTSTPGATASTATRTAARSVARSALLSRTTGCAAAPGDGEEPLETPEVEVAIEPRDEERAVDVGGQDLVGSDLAVLAVPHQRRASRQDRGHHGGRGVGRDTQSPTAGRSGRAASCRRRPATVAARSPAARATLHRPRWAATTRAGSRPRRGERRERGGPASSQPRPAGAREGAGVGAGDDGAVHRQPTRLSLPVRFAYRSARPNAHSPSGMNTTPMTISGHDVSPAAVDRRPVEERRPDAVEDVGRRRELARAPASTAAGR